MTRVERTYKQAIVRDGGYRSTVPELDVYIASVMRRKLITNI